MHASEVWEGTTVSARLARAALTPLSWLYAAGWQTYLAAYRIGLKRAEEPHSPVVCVGNLMVGGSGKSPTTIHLARLIQQIGMEVVVSASGYGAPHAEAATIAPSGPLSAQEWGDEPAMLRWLLPNVPLIVGRRRVLAARLCHERYPNATMLMDDGFQHLPLRKQIQILLDPEDPPNRRCLPAGPYREPRSNRSRADLVLPGRFRLVAEQPELITPEGTPCSVPAEFSVLCALGQPQRFIRSLPKPPSKAILLGDHDPLTAGNLVERLPKSMPVVVTAKDWVKLRERPDVHEREFLVAKHEVRIEPEGQFREWLEGKLNEFRP